MISTSSAAQFRSLLARPGIVRSLGAHDVFSAWIMERAGLEMVFLGGFGASASLLGLPDLNFLTASEMADAVRRTTARLTIPVIADGDTGHGDLHNVQRTVTLFEQAGAAGILLEDQVTPKRCGHFERKPVIPAEEMVAKIRAAVQARHDPDFVIFARTDARQTHGLDDAIDRVNRYCDAGAEVAFVEAPQSIAELEEVPRRVAYPLLANMLTGGVTPILSADELAQLGYKIVVFPVESLMVSAAALQRLCAAVLQTGRADQVPVDALSFAELKALLGVQGWMDLHERL